MYRLLLTPKSITLLQEDGSPLVTWTWAERSEAIAMLQDCGFTDGAEALENLGAVAALAPVAEQLRFPEAA